MDVELTPFQALELAIEKSGSQSELARQLSVSQPTVWKWLQAKRVGDAYVLKVAELLDIPPYVLRPDLYPRDLPHRFYGVDRRAQVRA